MKTRLPDQIFILQSKDEMRHPYEATLLQLCDKVVWFTSYDQLIAVSEREVASVIIVDLDCVGLARQEHLTQLRALFAESDLIALSSTDSSQLALLCLRSGFVDFILKPASPEELSWVVRKCEQRRDFLNRIQSPGTGMVGAITRISTCTTPTLVQLSVLEYLHRLLDSQGSAWLDIDLKNPESTKITCSVPRNAPISEINYEIPYDALRAKKDLVFLGEENEMGKLILPCRDFPKNGIFIWGIRKPITTRLLNQCRLIIEHADISLLNLQKFDEIKQQTFIDDLTGLYNSRYLKYALATAILKSKQPGKHFSVLFIDVDHFKNINDQHGHLVGSEFLTTIAKTIKNAVRAIDPVFRYGGDEFVVIVQETDVQGAKEIAERIRKNIERRVFVLGICKIRTTVSIGIATYPEHAAERDEILRLADQAMYSVKRTSRNAVHLAFEATPTLKAA